mmetsp:Transcript_10436/g.23615  ORF Transcript_10436/g.23615 Transcript_10436/m.23615 type:complete len:208 (-) Transcript_10436:1325-1948(-)
MKEVELHDPEIHGVLQVMKASGTEDAHLLWKRFQYLPNHRLCELRDHTHTLCLHSGLPATLVQTKERQLSKERTWMIVLDDNVVLARLRLTTHEDEALMADAAFCNDHFTWQKETGLDASAQTLLKLLAATAKDAVLRKVRLLHAGILLQLAVPCLGNCQEAFHFLRPALQGSNEHGSMQDLQEARRNSSNCGSGCFHKAQRGHFPE